MQLAAQLTFLAILPYLNPDGLISRGAHVGGNGNYESDWDAPTGEYMLGPNEYVVEQDYHTDFYGNRYGKYDRHDNDGKKKFEFKKPLEVEFDGLKPSVTLQKPIEAAHLSEDEVVNG